MRTDAAKKIILALTPLCISFCLAAALAASPAQRQQDSEAGPQPTIQVKEPCYNFGKIMEGTPEIEHEFTVRNTGTDVLKIERVQTG